jgi:hypothetical protein
MNRTKLAALEKVLNFTCVSHTVLVLYSYAIFSYASTNADAEGALEKYTLNSQFQMYADVC